MGEVESEQLRAAGLGQASPSSQHSGLTSPFARVAVAGVPAEQVLCSRAVHAPVLGTGLPWHQHACVPARKQQMIRGRGACRSMQ